LREREREKERKKKKKKVNNTICSHHDTAEILLKMAFITNQSIFNVSIIAMNALSEKKTSLLICVLCYLYVYPSELLWPFCMNSIKRNKK